MSDLHADEAVVFTDPADRLLTFEIGDTLYALPIASVREVVAVDRIASVPTRAPDCVGVMNYHGDALPVVERSALLGLPEAEPSEPEQVLVISGPGNSAARLGLLVDKVAGLVDSGRVPTRGVDLVVERRPVEGRVVSVLNPLRLLARAKEVIERPVLEAGAFQGGRR